LSDAELPYANNLVNYLYSDELTDLSSTARLSDMATTYANWRSLYPNVLVGTNGNPSPSPTAAVLANYMKVTQPDLVMFDSYTDLSLSNSARKTWYQRCRCTVRRAGGNDGTGKAPIVYSQYLDLYRTDLTKPLPSESFVRLQQFASWAFGYTMTDAFMYKYVDSNTASALFNTTDDSTPNGVQLRCRVESREPQLGPALVRLVSSGIFMKPGTGLSVSGTGLTAWSAHAGTTAGYTTI